MQYTAIILGAGAIGAGYDKPEQEHILTHAHAYTKHPCIQLVGFYDTNAAQAEVMAKKWQTQAIDSLASLQHIDIISICTPDYCHQTSLLESLFLKPKIFFLEKPAGTTRDEIKQLLEISQKIPIQVNYSRRFIPQFQQLAKQIHSGDLGKFITGHGFYGKGYVHNGSHMRDLLEYFLGPIISIKELRAHTDFYTNDPTKDVQLCFNNGIFFMQGVDCTIVTVFEFDLIFEHCRIRIVDGGQKLEKYSITSDSLYTDYKIFSHVSNATIQTSSALKNAVNNLIDHLEYGKQLLSPLRDFI